MPDRLSRLSAANVLSVAELMEKWRSYPPGDSPDRSGECRCPACRVVMEKGDKHAGVKVDHHACKSCSLVWLDAGEIELYQLAYLVSAKGKEAQQFKEIHQNMTPMQKSQLAKLIKHLPDELGEPGNLGGPLNPFGDLF